MADVVPPALELHFAKLEEWLDDRAAVLAKKHPAQFTTVKTKAPLLLHHLKYEIPLICKQLQKARSVLDEGSKRIEDANRAIIAGKKQRIDSLVRYGLLSDNRPDALQGDEKQVEEIAGCLDTLLQKRGVEVSTTLDETAADLATQLTAVEATYDAVLKRHKFFGDKCSFESHFPWLKGLMQHKGQQLKLSNDVSDTNEKGVAESGVPSGVVQPTIDWGDVEVACGSDAAVIEVDAAALTAAPAEADGYEVRPSGAVHAHNDKHRSRILDECCAVEAFLNQRICETPSGACEELRQQLERVMKLKHALEDEVTLQILRAHHSVAHKEELMGRIDQVRRVVDRALSSQHEWQVKMQQAAEDLTRLESEQTHAAHIADTLRKECEVALREIYKPRDVVIIGGDVDKLSTL